MQSKLNPEIAAAQHLSDTFEDRFWSKVNVTENCWIWTAGRQVWGYGKIGRGAAGMGMIPAHVASWLIHFGEIPNGYFVLHKCDNPPCVNPDHLWLGTVADNSRDMVEKGRSCVGSKNAMSKLTTEKVIQIREIHSEKVLNQRQIARTFGVNFRTINYIIHRKLWKHI